MTLAAAAGVGVGPVVSEQWLEQSQSQSQSLSRVMMVPVPEGHSFVFYCCEDGASLVRRNGSPFGRHSRSKRPNT